VNSEFRIPQIIVSCLFKFKITLFKTLVFFNRTRIISIILIQIIKIILTIWNFLVRWRRPTWKVCLLFFFRYQIIRISFLWKVNWRRLGNIKATVARFISRIITKVPLLFFFITVYIHLRLWLFDHSLVTLLYILSNPFLLFPELILILIFFLKHRVDVSNGNYFIKLVIFFHLAIAEHQRSWFISSYSLRS